MIINSFDSEVKGTFKLYTKEHELISEFELTTQEQYDNWANNCDELLFPGKKGIVVLALEGGTNIVG